MKIKFLIKTMVVSKRLTGDFFTRDVLVVAPEMLGKMMVIRLKDGIMWKVHNN